MTAKEVLDQLKSMGNEKVMVRHTKNGAGENQFGVKLGIDKDYPVSKGCTSPFTPPSGFMKSSEDKSFLN